MTKLLLQVFTISLLLIQTSAFAEVQKPNLHFYFDPSVSFNPDIPTPETVLGYQVGEWHVRHDQLVEYMYTLAQSSDRVAIEKIGVTHEQRPLLLVTFASPQNLQRLPEIQQNQQSLNTKENPNVIWMGYSVHGNEPSGANASLLVAYYLAAAQDQRVEKLLANTVVLMEPTINPDGLARFASWANSHKSINTLVADRNHREHTEGWPKGRTNHYWFDLNRDWLLLQHPESRARIAQFHKWQPQVVTDFHEMGADRTYFFQPGVKSRQNPLTPDKNFELTAKIAKFHAAALDEEGQSYYSQEGFDDYYFGKGSTYPDIHGAIGILFEQSSSRGHLHESIHGDKWFPETIKNQLTTSLSTFDAVLTHAKELKAYQRDFNQQSLELAADDDAKAYVLHGKGDNQRLMELANLLLQHKIQVYLNPITIKHRGKVFEPGQSIVIPTKQRQYRLLKSLFETRTEFQDNTFYDVSTWNMAAAFNLEFAELDRGDYSKRLLTEPLSYPVQTSGSFNAGAKVAYAYSWDQFYAARATYELLDQGVNLYLTTKEAAYPSGESQHLVPEGTILIPLGMQDLSLDQINAHLAKLALRDGLQVLNIDSGLSLQGVDLGSPSIKKLQLPKPLLVVGDKISSYEAGEAWFVLDQRVNLPVTMVEQRRLPSIDLSKYTHLLLVNGKYDLLTEKRAKKIKSWIKAGGTLVTTQKASSWLAKQSIIKLSYMDKMEWPQDQRKFYAERDDFNVKHLIGGAIFNTSLDTSHPLAFGVGDDKLSVFRTHNKIMQMPENPFATLARYDADPLFSGYASKENQQRIAYSAAIVAERVGKGSVVVFADNPNFRGYWYGTQKLFINSLFFSKAFSNPRKYSEE